MVPAVGAIWLVIALVRALQRRNGSASGELSMTVRRGYVGFLFLTAAGVWLLVDVSPAPLLIGTLGMGMSAGNWLADGVSVPLGLPRISCALYWLSGGARSAFERRPSAGLAAARALLRRPSEGGARFVERYLGSCVELGTTGAAALSLVALSRGDEAQALAIFQLLDAIGREQAEPAAVRVALEHLAVEALAAGDWRRVAVLGDRPDASRLTRFLGSVSRVALGDPDAHSPGQLRLAWLLTPRRRLTRAVIAAASRVVARPPAVETGPTLAALAALLQRAPTAVRSEDVAAAVLSLDAMRESPAVLATIARRVLAVGATTTDAEAVLSAVLRDAESDLAAALLQAEWPLAWVPRGKTGDAVRGLVEGERLRSAELLTAELGRRARARRDLPEAEEWHAWADARRACDKALADGVAAATVFQAAFGPLTEYAVRLCNVRTRRVLAGDIFWYLRELAWRAQARDAYDLTSRNANAVRAERLPAAEVLEGTPIGDQQRVRRLQLRVVPLLAVLFIGGIFAISGLLALPELIGETPGKAVAGLLAGFLGVILVVRLPVRLVLCARTPDGLVIQSNLGRYVAQAGDLAKVTAGPGGLVLLRLRRAPRWLPRTVFTLAEGRAGAQAGAEAARGALTG